MKGMFPEGDEAAKWEALTGLYGPTEQDPFVTRALMDGLAIYNDLSESIETQEDLGFLTEDLNSLWKGYLGKMVSVSGQADMFSVNTVSRRLDAPRPVLLSSQRMQFGGFVISHDGELNNKTLQLTGSHALDITSEGDYDGAIYTFNPGTYLTFDGVFSSEHVRSTLEHYLPSAMEEIDLAILNGTEGSASRVLALADVCLDEVYKLDPTKARQVLNMLEGYLGRVADIDSDSDYAVSYRGELIAAGELTEQEMQDTPLKVSGLGVTSTRADGRHGWQHRLSLLGRLPQSSADEDVWLELFIKNIRDLA